METLILVVLSILPVFLLGRYIYTRDKNREPINLLIKLFVAGISSCFLVVVVSIILGLIFPIFRADMSTLNLLELAIHVFIGIALVEELCKFIMSYYIAFNNREFEEVFDMIVYSVFVALGFAFFENLLYVLDGGIGVGILRALLAVPGHACNGIFMGYYLGMAKMVSINGDKKLKKKYLVFSILVPMVIHGIYDYCLFTQKWIFLILFLIFIVYVYIYSFKKVKLISLTNKKFIDNDYYCLNCGTLVNDNYCTKCGRRKIL